MFKKMMLLVLFVMVFAVNLFANGDEKVEKNDELYEVKKVIERKLNYEDLKNINEPTFEDWISTEIFIDIPLFNKVFPKAELVIQICDIYKPSRKRIVAKFKGKQYGILAINLLYNQTKKETKTSVVDRIRLYFKFKSISTKLTQSNVMGQKKRTYEFKITSIKRIEKKPNEKGIIHDCKYKVQVMYDKEITDYLFYIENDCIKRIEYFKDGKFDGSLPILQPKIKNEKQSRTINFSAGGINVVHETVITPTTTPHTYEHYYLKVSDNGSATNDSIDFSITGLQPNQGNARL
jgi:hypothetical protein